MKPYPAYKDSGIEWIGEIPEHWSLLKLKQLIQVKDGTHATPQSVEPSSITYPLITSKDIKNGNIDFSTSYHISETDYLEANRRSNVQNGDIIMPMIGTVGNPVIVNTDKLFSIKNVALFKTSTSKYDTRHIHYCLLSDFVTRQFDFYSRGGVQSFVSLDLLRNLYALKIPMDEQYFISDYLDHKTSQIDTLIEKKQKQIELLKEERTAIINQAVTKGLNPDVPMKDSGIEWLGEVPEHWNNHKISHIATKITNGYVGPTRDILMENGVRYLQSLHIKNNEISFNPPYYVSQKWSNMHKRSILEKGDVLVVQTGDIGQVAVVKEDFAGCNCHALIILTPDGTNVNGEYLSLILNSNYGYHTLKSIQTGALHPHLNSSNVKDIQVPLPPLKEQIQIMEFLHNYSTTNSTSVKTIKQQITLLQEYRTSLISNAVTGKIDVREYHGNST